MKVLYFHQHFSTPKGSTGTRSYEMAKRLVAEGHEVTMVCGSSEQGKRGLKTEFQKGFRRGNVDGIDVIEFELEYSNSDGFVKRTRTFLSFAFKSIKLVFTEQYDLVFATTTPLTAGIPGLFARWLKGKPFVFEVRDLWPEIPKAMGVITNPIVLFLMTILEWVTYRSAHKCIGLSPGIVDGIARCGVSRENITLIPNGCDFDIFSPNGDIWRPENVGETDLMAVFTGTHGMANGLDSVLDVAKVLKYRQRQDIKLVLIGTGKLKPALIERAHKESLKNVIFLDPVDKVKLSKLMRGANLGLQILDDIPAFYYGTSPNKFFDYIASGLPVLNNYPGWLADLIKQNECGYVTEPGNSESFADLLERAASDRAELARMSENSLRLAKEQFDRRELSRKFVTWLESSQAD